jgi:hypothetical protein
MKMLQKITMAKYLLVQEVQDLGNLLGAIIPQSNYQMILKKIFFFAAFITQIKTGTFKN